MPAENVRAAFREVALGLMEWPPPEYARGLQDGRTGREPSGSWFEPPRRSTITEDERWYLEGFNTGRQARILRPRGKQEIPEYVEPFDVQADWNERA